MKKYTRLTCSVCNRYADRLVDLRHAVPDRCTITLECTGRLFPVEYRSSAEITSLPKAGVSDWHPRSLTPSATLTTIPAAALVSTSNGVLQQLVLAVDVNGVAPFTGQTVMLTLGARADTPKQFLQYIYKREAEFNTIAGAEDVPSPKTLRYDMTTDLVEVYINGAKLEYGVGPDQYQLHDGPSSSVPSNTVSFNSVVEVTTPVQVDVVVSKLVTITTSETLTFTYNGADESRTSLGAWENVGAVEIFASGVWKPYHIFTHDLAENSVIQKDAIYYPISLTGSVNGELADGMLLFSREPYTQVDRYTNLFARLDDLDMIRDYLKLYSENGQLRMDITDTSISTVYPLLRVVKHSPELPLTDVSTGQTEQRVLDSPAIVGPDA